MTQLYPKRAAVESQHNAVQAEHRVEVKPCKSGMTMLNGGDA
jgi:hypothetical protein